MSYDELLITIPQQLSAIRVELEQLRAEVRKFQHGERVAYNLKEAATLMGVSPDSLYNKFRAGVLVCSQDGPGGNILVAREELERWLASTRAGEDIRALEAEIMARPVRSGKGPLRVTHKREKASGKAGKH